jgi:glucose/arabinose dehydrogenase
MFASCFPRHGITNRRRAAPRRFDFFPTIGIAAAALWTSAAHAQPAVGSRPFRIEELRTPPGFEVTVYASGISTPRHMAFGPNGVLYVATRHFDRVVAVPRAGETVIVLQGLNGPHSLAFRGTDLYVAQDNGILLFRDATPPDLIIRSEARRIADLPSDGGHGSRTIGVSPGGQLFATAGSSCNLCNEADPRRAAMMRYELDGSGGGVHARGLRNTVGFAWHPVTGELWGVENGADGLGEDQPPEEINIIVAGGDYGWPDCDGNQRPVEWGPEARPGRCPQTRAPEYNMTAHSAPLGISFYTGLTFPQSYYNDALVAQHGSWNRNDPSGAKVVRIRAASGRASGEEDFLWGFYDPATRTRSGRPVHAIAGPDGAVYVSDDLGGRIFRVAYTGPRIFPGGIVQRAPRIFELYGSNLVDGAGEAAITANGAPVELLYTSPGQVNFAIPEHMSGEVLIAAATAAGRDESVINVE